MLVRLRLPNGLEEPTPYFFDHLEIGQTVAVGALLFVVVDKLPTDEEDVDFIVALGQYRQPPG
ncbi:hypothetical protein KZ820_14510 [Sphingomonas sp. RRHST34]|uniref:Uncharacterized protein n=1 Tax=Sphingomonas citri TaxID=2862499 RepID=A0ABS7BQT4_9SPHN|nr:hypothetical protein [Sphingomonas citri]MBW6531951.1 hypothetical protein [Sphingomonas citri]